MVPLLSVVGWLLFGPRRLTSASVARRSLIFPIAWMVFTLARGAGVHWYPYPYPFLDVDRIGYARAVVNSVWVAGLFLTVAGGAVLLDRLLSRAASTVS